MPRTKTTEANDAVVNETPEVTMEATTENDSAGARSDGGKESENDETDRIGNDEVQTSTELPTEPKPKATRTRRKTSAANSSDTAPQPASSQPNWGAQASILTIDTDGEIETPESREDVIWHEVRNAYRTRKILTGVLGGIEKTDNGKIVAVLYYKEFRVIIPTSEMMINLIEDDRHRYGDLSERQSKILGNMLGSEIDFIVKGLDSKTRSIVASRKDAMLKKRQVFYMGASPANKIQVGRIVQARVIAVAQKVIRVEVFGVECSILARDLSWDWIGDAHERYSVGDQVLVRILKVNAESAENISITADVKSATPNTSLENLKKCRIQGKYAGKVTDIHKGVVYVRLSIGVNAIAHSCYDSRTPGKKDDISFAVTHIDEDKSVAVGIITRIIKQNM